MSPRDGVWKALCHQFSQFWTLCLVLVLYYNCPTTTEKVGGSSLLREKFPNITYSGLLGCWKRMPCMTG